MENITISDIAKKAKVSIATVSNVLNKKGNVKIATIRKVEDAARQLGYVRNEIAQAMKKGDLNTILFLIPVLSSTVSPLIIDLLHDLKFNGMDLKVIEIDNLGEIANLTNFLRQGQYKAAICLASIKDKEIYDAIPPNKIITIGSSQGVYNHIELGLENFFQNITNVDEFTIIPDKRDFSIYEMIMNNFSDKKTVFNVVDLDDNDIPESFFSLDFKKFIVFSPDVIEKILSFYEDSDTNPPQFVLISCKTGYQIYDSLKIKKFYFSSNELTLKIIKLIKSLYYQTSRSKVLKEKVNIYLTDQKVLKPINSQQTIKLLLLKNPFSKALKRLAFKFTKETNINIEISDLSFNELNKLIIENKAKEYDMVKLDVSYFPWLGPDLFLDLASIPEIISLSNQMKGWNRYCYVNEQLLGLPADPSIQMMLYRKDVFENPVIQKAYSERFGQPLLPPEKYDDLAKYSEFYQTMNIPEKSIPFPLSINEGNGILLSSEFLPYFYSLGGKIKYLNSVFEISPSAFVETLNYYKKIRNHSKLENEGWWNSEIENFNNNLTTMIICYTNHLNQISEIDYGYCPIPGRHPAFGGGVLGITRESKKLKENILFFQWLYQYRIQEQLASLGVCVPRTHLFDERNNYRKYPFLSYSSKNFTLGERLQDLDNRYVINTIEIEKIIGTEINLGLKNGNSDYDILVKIHNQLNLNKKKIIRKILRK